MNRGVFQSSLVQQMIGQSPSWWSMNNIRPPPDQQTFSLLSSHSSSSGFPQYSPLLVPACNTSPWHGNQDLPESWSQLLLGGDMQEEEKYGLTANYLHKKIENWEDQTHYPTIKKDYSGTRSTPEEIIQISKSQWNQVLPAAAASSPRSCITSSNNILDFSNNCKAGKRHHKAADNSSECNSTGSGVSFKKARVQGSSPSSTQSNCFKVRKEKLGDRITTLHQIVSPFGKTDTASVLLEAIGYIRFLQSQIEALSSPYLACGSGTGFGSGSILKQPVSKDGGEEEEEKDLKSRGLCLVPMSVTSHLGSDSTAADFWAPALGGGF